MRRTRPFVICLLCAACGSWPDVPPPGGEVSAAWPSLRPLTELTSGPGEAQDGDDAALVLKTRADALRRRADVLRAPVADSDAFETLRARLAR